MWEEYKFLMDVLTKRDSVKHISDVQIGVCYLCIEIVFRGLYNNMVIGTVM